MLTTVGLEPTTFQPVSYGIFTREHEGRSISIINEWCYGFMQGMTLDAAGWQRLLESDDLQHLIFPIMLYGTEASWRSMEEKPDLADKHEEFVDALPSYVRALREHWLPARKAALTLRREAPKVGPMTPVPVAVARSSRSATGRNPISTEHQL